MSGSDPFQRLTQQAFGSGYGPAAGVRDMQRMMAESTRMWFDLWRMGCQAWMAPFSLVPDRTETCDRDQELAAIRAQYAKCHEAFCRRDAEATASFYAPDVVQWNESQPTCVGRDKVEQGFAGLFQLPDLEASYFVEKLELSPLGDEACEFGRIHVKYSAVDDAKPQIEALDWSGRYMVVWRKIDGQWLMTFDMTNSLPPQES